MLATAAIRRILLTCTLLVTASSQAAWEALPADDVIADLFESQPPADPLGAGRVGFDDDGVARFPGCAAPPVLDPDHGVVPLAPDFTFFADLGDSGRKPTGLLIYLGSGGVCWDAGTCLGSLIPVLDPSSGNLITPLPSYFPFFTEQPLTLNALSASKEGGVLTNAASGFPNPYADYAKIYVPYCTGDVHVGSSDTIYGYGPIPQWPIRHRGFDNLRLVLKWIQAQQEKGGRLSKISDITVAGQSAGAYGTLINLPNIRATLGNKADYSIIVDSANGILTDGFVDRAFGVGDGEGETGVWGARAHIDPLLLPLLDGAADSLLPNVFDTLGAAYPATRFSQSTSAYDVIQVLILKFMQAVDNGSYDPLTFGPTEEELFTSALFEWSPRARAGMLETAFRVPNYRRYLAKGIFHERLVQPIAGSPVFFETQNFFDEDSAGNVAYTDWLDDMLNNPRSFWGTDWRNLTCFPNCLPDLTELP